MDDKLMKSVTEILKNLPNILTSVEGAVQSISITWDEDREGKPLPNLEIKFYDVG